MTSSIWFIGDSNNKVVCFYRGIKTIKDVYWGRKRVGQKYTIPTKGDNIITSKYRDKH